MDVMNIMQAPEMTRTNPAHVGSAKLTSLVPGSENTSSVKNDKSFGTFESYLVNAVSEMNSQQLDVNRVQEKLITAPDSVDIHDVTTAMAKAQMSLNLAQTVIDRLVSGWSEISTTR